MMYMHCQVRFTDYATWKASMDADAEAQRKAGLYLKYLWRGVEDQNVAFFLHEVTDKNQAKAFLDPVNVAEPEISAGASDFTWYVVEQISI